MKKLVPLLPAVVALATLGVVWLTSVVEPSFAAKAFGVGCAVCSMLAAVVPRRPDMRAHASVSFAAGAMVAAGQVPHDAGFIVMCVPFLAACVASLRRPRVAPAPLRRRPVPEGASFLERHVGRRARGPLVLAFAVGAGVAAVLVAVLPPASRAMEAQVDKLFAGRMEMEQRIGFSSRLRLGSTTRMLTSDRVVLHVEGEAPELLVGGVYDRYEGDVWIATRESERIAVVATKPPTSSARILATRSARLTRGAQARFFLPPGTCRFGTPSGKATVDGSGIARPSTRDDLTEVVVQSRADADAAHTSCERALELPRPSPEDLSVPPSLRRELEAVAGEWAPPDEPTAPHATLETFARRLRGFGYSLSVTRNPRIDPVIDLLTEHREGHCEMFSAALALLARTRGIPARVVTGYRVSEKNPLTGASVVRERNAHAWVVAWVDDRWVTVDPTPAAELAHKPRPSWLEHLWDAAGTEVDRLWARLLTVDPVAVGLGFVALALAFLGVRRALAAIRASRPREALATAATLAAYDALEAALARAGLRRRPSEPIERFALRVAGVEETWATEAADAIRRYAALRYGGTGSERDVGSDLDALARRIATSST